LPLVAASLYPAVVATIGPVSAGMTKVEDESFMRMTHLFGRRLHP
jgi:hypothetical protein